ncbi:hypothetical protein RJ641_025869 [Dillenia turbinata]|uniref:Uncharacterized protein n=1 Tax=Dillenia turbinata TaxID=194707 RepID=A0AAN8WAK8_9MAGN
MTPSTTPPATMLSKKLFSDGVTPEAASATSGITMEAVIAAAVAPAIAFSFIEEAFTWNLPPVFAASIAFDGLTDSGLKNASEPCSLFWMVEVNGKAIMTAEVEAIDVSSPSGNAG